MLYSARGPGDSEQCILRVAGVESKRRHRLPGQPVYEKGGRNLNSIINDGRAHDDNDVRIVLGYNCEMSGLGTPGHEHDQAAENSAAW